MKKCSSQWGAGKIPNHSGEVRYVLAVMKAEDSFSSYRDCFLFNLP
jgi:hypothetical protein